jgi:hypothetical protein
MLSPPSRSGYGPSVWRPTGWMMTSNRKAHPDLPHGKSNVSPGVGSTHLNVKLNVEPVRSGRPPGTSRRLWFHGPGDDRRLPAGHRPIDHLVECAPGPGLRPAEHLPYHFVDSYSDRLAYFLPLVSCLEFGTRLELMPRPVLVEPPINHCANSIYVRILWPSAGMRTALAFKQYTEHKTRTDEPGPDSAKVPVPLRLNESA